MLYEIQVVYEKKVMSWQARDLQKSEYQCCCQDQTKQLVDHDHDYEPQAYLTCPLQHDVVFTCCEEAVSIC